MRMTVLWTLVAAAALRLAVLAGAGDALADWIAAAGAADTALVAAEPDTDETAAAPESAAPVLRPVIVTPRVRQEEAQSAGELSPPPEPVPADLSEPVAVHDRSGWNIDVAALEREGLNLRLSPDAPQILILHTHSSEAYTPDETDRYVASDPYRTEDKTQSVIRVGDALAEALEESGLRVLHDREIYDYPSYTGSYSRSGAAVERWLADYPSLRIVIDLHRDAIGSGDVVYRTRAVLDGASCAQVMLLAGTGANGLSHPNWRENLKLALWLQRTAEASCPGLMRPLEIVPERYNQQLSPGSLILEVGSTGNSLREAVLAATYFGRAVGPGLAEYITNAAD